VKHSFTRSVLEILTPGGREDNGLALVRPGGREGGKEGGREGGIRETHEGNDEDEGGKSNDHMKTKLAERKGRKRIERGREGGRGGWTYLPVVKEQGGE